MILFLNLIQRSAYRIPTSIKKHIQEKKYEVITNFEFNGAYAGLFSNNGKIKHQKSK